MLVHFATNRNEVGGDELFGTDFRSSPPLYQTGTIDVHHQGGNPLPNWVPDPSSLKIDPIPRVQLSIPELVSDPAKDSNALSTFVEKLSSRSVKEEAQSLSAILFLPGFNSTFISAMSSSAQIAAAYAANNIFCFSWPSQGEFGLAPYLKDEKSAYASGDAIALALSNMFVRLLGKNSVRRNNLALVCHSMGNGALSAALQYIAISSPRLLSENYFNFAFLMAADEDSDALDEPKKLQRLLTLASHTEIYTNASDAAMFLSNIVNLKAPLGSFGPVGFGTLPDKVVWIDCTDVGNTQENDGSTDWGHQYFRNSPTVTADVHQVLEGLPPDKVGPRIPDQDFPTRKFVIPFDRNSIWSRARGY